MKRADGQTDGVRKKGRAAHQISSVRKLYIHCLVRFCIPLSFEKDTVKHTGNPAAWKLVLLFQYLDILMTEHCTQTSQEHYEMFVLSWFNNVKHGTPLWRNIVTCTAELHQTLRSVYCIDWRRSTWTHLCWALSPIGGRWECLAPRSISTLRMLCTRYLVKKQEFSWSELFSVWACPWKKPLSSISRPNELFMDFSVKEIC